MARRKTLGGHAARLHELLDELLDREDVALLLFDGRRGVTYMNGFGLSPCQLELVAFDIERILRGHLGTQPETADGGIHTDKSTVAAAE